MAPQAIDPIAAKFGGTAVAPAEPAEDPIAQKYGGTIDPVALKYGALPVDPATGRPKPPQVDRQFTSGVKVTDVARPTGPLGSAKTGGAAMQPPAGQGLPFLDEIPAGLTQAGGGAKSLFGLASDSITDAIQHPPVVSAEPHVTAPRGNPTAAITAIKAGNDILEGGFKVLSPLVYAGAVVNPVGTAAALAGAWAGSKAVQTGATALGAPEPVARFGGDLAALLTGSLAAHAATKGTFGTPEEAAAKTATNAEAAQVAAAARKAATDALGVDVNADQETIRSAYRAAARKAHPDVGGTPSAMADLNLAYEWLEDHPAPAVNTPPTVTLSGWIKEQATWLRSKFPSRMADAADRAANPPVPSSEGRALAGVVDQTAAKFGGEPVEPLVDEGGLPLGGYAGPERRSVDQAPPDGTERRRIPAEQVRADLLNPEMVKAAEEMKRRADQVTHAEVDPVAAQFGGTPVTSESAPEEGRKDYGPAQREIKAAFQAGENVAGTTAPPKYSIFQKLSPAYQDTLRKALSSFEGGVSRWDELRRRGATDPQILEQAGQEFGISGSASTGVGHDHKGGKNPQLILGTSSKGERIKLNGPKLAATIREALGIPQPVPTLGGGVLAARRPVGLWEMNPDELQTRLGFDISKPWESGPNATSTQEQLTAFSEKLIDSVLNTIDDKGREDSLAGVKKLLRSVEHLRDTSDGSEWNYTWEVEPFTRTIPELERIVQMLEGQRDLPIERPETGELALTLKQKRKLAEHILKTATDPAIKAAAQAALDALGDEDDDVLHERPTVDLDDEEKETAATPTTAAAADDRGFKAGDEVHFKESGRHAVGTIREIITAGKKGGTGIKALRRRARIAFTAPDGQKFETHRDLDEISKVTTSAPPETPSTKDSTLTPSEERADLIERIVDAARKPEPDVVESIEVKGTNGKWYGPGGMPVGVMMVAPPEKRSVGFVVRTSQGTTVGKRWPTKDALLEHWRAQEDANAADFRKTLEQRDELGLQSAADYWLKDRHGAKGIEPVTPEGLNATKIAATFIERVKAAGFRVTVHKNGQVTVRGERHPASLRLLEHGRVGVQFTSKSAEKTPEATKLKRIIVEWNGVQEAKRDWATVGKGAISGIVKLSDEELLNHVDWIERGKPQPTTTFAPAGYAPKPINATERDKEMSKLIDAEYRAELARRGLTPKPKPVQLTEGARRAGEKKLKLLERRYGIQSTRYTSAVRDAETDSDLADALAAAETEFKAHEAKQDAEKQKNADKLSEAQRKAIEKGRAFLAEKKKIVWRVAGFGKGQEYWEPMEGGPVVVAGAPGGVTFSAFKETDPAMPKGWRVVEDESGRTIASRPGGTKAGAVTASEQVIANLAPGQWEKAMAAAKKNGPPKPDLTKEPVDDVAAKFGGEKVANPESRYQGDDLDDLLTATEEEQSGRFEAMLRLEKALEENAGKPDRTDKLTKELKDLRTVYQGTYSEIADAAGHAAMEEMQGRVEKGRVSLAEEILNPPKGKGEPANEQERLAAREEAKAKKAAKNKPSPGISYDQMTEAELKSLLDIGTGDEPSDAAKELKKRQGESGAAPAKKTLATKAFDVILSALQQGGIRDPFPKGAVEFRKWMAEQLDVPVELLVEGIDVINDAAEAALAAHLRTEADTERLDLAMTQAENYEALLPRAHRTLEKSKLQQFSTPLPIGLLVGEAADLRDGDRVLEPTAGTGSLLAGVPKDIPVTAIELAPRRVDLLKAAGINTVEADYLSYPAGKAQPTVIVTNPPWGKYSTGKYGKGVAIGFGPTDVAERFVGKNMRDLAEGGRLVAVMPTTMHNAASFKAWLKYHYTVQAIIQAPPGAYDTRSTGVDSVLLVVDKVKPAAGAAWPKTVTTADWEEYRDAVAAIPERTHEPETLATGGRPAETPRPDSGRGTGSVSRPAPAGGRPARPKSGPDTAVAPGRAPDLVAGGQPAGGTPAKPAGEFAARVSGPSADARAKAARSESFAPYTRRSALRGAGHPKLVVEARQLAGVDYPPLTIEPGPATTDALADGRLSVEQAEQALAAVQANIVGHHGYLAADAVGVGKSREIALTVLEAMERAKADGRELRLVLLTKSSDNIADLVNREMYYVATGRTKDGTDLADPGAEKRPGKGLPFVVEMVEDRKGAKKHGTNEYEPLPVHKHAVYVISSFGLAPYEGALEDVGAHGVVGDEAHRFKNIEGAAVGGAWQRLHALIMRDVPRPEQFFAYFTATPAQTVEDYAYLYGLRLWPVDGFGNWLNLVTGSLSEAEAKKLQADTDKGAIDIDRVTGNDGGDVVGGDGENTSGAKKKGGGITNRSAFDARLTPTEGEQIPREWKMLGRFSARDLWRDGTEFSIHEAKLSAAHAKKYDQFVDLAQDIIETAGKYGTMDKSGKASRFGVTGLLQFAAKRIQMQPAIEEAIKLAQKEVASGHQAVLSLINVSEMNDERGHLQAAIDKINTRNVDVDPDDPDGGFQDLGEIPEAIVDQARLRDRVRDLGTFDDPLKLVEDAVGKENVAFITGETAATRQAQVAAFQAGKRDYAVLSAAGSTGINLDHRVFTDKLPGRGRRVFIDVQYEWSATESLQRYGRVDRASSITPPKIYALTFGSAAEKKFLATIANRMAALGAFSKGGAESTGGASALEEFEITGDDALAAARKAYEELPREGKTQFARIKSVFRDPNRETRPDQSGYNPYAPKPTASGTTMQDFQLPLLFMPMAESNAFWKRFIELRDEIREASGQNRASRTERFKGEILHTAKLKENLTLYSVKNEANQKFGILTGLVTQELPKIRQALKGGDYDATTGRYESKFTRRYVTFTSADQTVTGLQIKWTDVGQVAALYDHHLQGEVLDTPEKVRQALVNGEKIPLQEKNPDSGKPWTLRFRQDQKIAIDHARMMDRALLLRHGADYHPVGGYWYVKDLAKFLDRFPIAEASQAPKKPSASKPSSGGGTTLQSTVLPGAAEFFEQDVLPGLKSAGDAFSQAAAQLTRAVAPATVGKGAQAAGALRAMMAREAQENARMMHAAAAFQTQFDRLVATPAGRDQAIDWWDAVQTGQVTKILPELKAAYDYMRQALDDERIELQKYGKLEDFNEFYFPQIWKFPKQEAAWIRRKIAGLMGKRPFEGSKGFLKQRKYPTFREGLDALLPKGVEPISYNPVDHFLVKMREMRRYRVARAAIKDFEAMGLWKAVHGGAKPPEGWQRIEGPLGTIYGRPTVAFKEAYDPDLFEGLERFARSLGVRLNRQPNIGGRRWGYAEGDFKITTKAAGPEGVLMHELGHILDERYGLRRMVNDKKFKSELRALADLRHEGTERAQMRPGFLRYIRKGEEKIANLVHAFLYAPERAKKLAPNSYWALYNLAKDHKELRPLLKLQKTRSLKLGVRSHEIDLGGFPEIGFYAMPDDAARVFNNHLSRGLNGQSAIYDAYRWLNNTMVTGQLAASGLFHATFTGLNALASEGGLALQELTLAAQKGDWSLAGQGAKRLATAGALGSVGAAAGYALGGPAGLLWATGYPLAGLKFVKGWRAQKAWMTQDPAGRFLADHIRQMQEGGFRPTWDQFYDNGAMKNAIRALKAGNYPGALARTIPAALDAVSAPIMRWLVPGVKTAAYIDAAGLELTRLSTHVAELERVEGELANLPQSPRERSALTPDQHRVIAALEAQRADNLSVIREALNKVQASIDNRFGEVVYDNWFWKRWLKDLTHIMFRSPGWQFGTYKEIGGAVTSQALIGARLVQRARGKGPEAGPDPEALLSTQMAWLLSVVGMVMLMGGLSHYLSTGERPAGRDWVYPKGPDGKRRAIPTYLRTIVSAYLHPMRTAGSITAPLNTMLYRLLVSNETYSGEMIREPGDPFLKQAWDALRLVVSEGYQPFVATNIARGESSLESMMGVAPAPAEIQRSAAENYLHDVLPPSPPRTHAQQQHVDATRAFRTALEQKNSEAAAKAAKDGELSRRSMMAGLRNARRDSLVRTFERASLDQAIHAYELATPEERLELRAPLARKWHSLFKDVPSSNKRAIADRFGAAIKLPVARLGPSARQAAGATR